MLRSVQLPAGVSGLLLLHSMPGRREPLDRVWEEIRRQQVQLLVSLAALSEIRGKSPTYAAALEQKAVPCAVESFPIRDFGVPEEREDFWALAVKVARQLRAGGRVLIHCGAGIGRTGTLATCVLLALEQPRAQAESAVSAAGSHPETAEQKELVSWCATRPPRVP